MGGAAESLSSFARVLRNKAGTTASWNLLCAMRGIDPYSLPGRANPLSAINLASNSPNFILTLHEQGVVSVCSWSLFSNTIVMLMACLRGTDETGAMVMTTLHFLVVASVKYAFDFTGIVKSGGSMASDTYTNWHRTLTGNGITGGAQSEAIGRLQKSEFQSDAGAGIVTRQPELIASILASPTRGLNQQFAAAQQAALASSELSHHDSALDLLFYGEELDSKDDADGQPGAKSDEDVSTALNRLFSTDLARSPASEILSLESIDSAPSRELNSVSIDEFRATIIHAAHQPFILRDL